MKNMLAKVYCVEHFSWEAGVFEQRLIDIEGTPIRSQDSNELRDDVDDLPEFLFVLANPFLRHLCHSDVRHCPYKLQSTGSVFCGMGHYVDMFDGIIGE